MNLFESIYRKFLTRNHRVADQPSTNVTSTPEKTTVTHSIGQVEDADVVAQQDPFSLYGTSVGLNVGQIGGDLLISRWRTYSQLTEADVCLSDIVGEAFSLGDDYEYFKLDLSKVEDTYEINSSRPLTEEIRSSLEKFDILSGFTDNVESYFRQFLVDGKFYFEAIYPLNEKDLEKKGIIDLQLLSPIGMRKVTIRNPETRSENDFIDNNRQYIAANDAGKIYDEMSNNPDSYDPNKKYDFYYYDKSSHETKQNLSTYSHEEESTIIFDAEQIIEANSGEYDITLKTHLSLMNGAIRALNHLSLVEDSFIIFCVQKSNSKRMFKISTKGLNRKSADQYVEGLKNKYSQKKFYNTSTGEVSSRLQSVSLNEDFWTSVGSDGVQSMSVENIPGVENASFEVMAYLDFFRKKAKEKFRIPPSRMNSETNQFNLSYDSSATAISRDELKFTKFCNKHRNLFMEVVFEFLKRDLVARKIIGSDDWYFIKKMIRFRFNNENEFAKVKKFQLMTQQLDLLDRIDTYREKGYYSKKFIEKEVLGRTDEEIEKMKEEIEEEMIESQVRIENQEGSLMDGGNDFGGGGGSSGGGFSGGFTPLPSSAGSISGDAFPEGFGEPEPNAPEEAPSPEEEAPPAEPEPITQSKDSDRRTNLIMEALKKHGHKVKEGGKITIAGKTYLKNDGIFLPEVKTS